MHFIGSVHIHWSNPVYNWFLCFYKNQELGLRVKKTLFPQNAFSQENQISPKAH